MKPRAPKYYTTSDWLGPGNAFEHVMKGGNDAYYLRSAWPVAWDPMAWDTIAVPVSLVPVPLVPVPLIPIPLVPVPLVFWLLDGLPEHRGIWPV